MKAVFDTNILISAVLWRGASYRCLLAAQAGLVELSLSEPILAEFRRVLTGKFRLAAEQVEETLLTVREMATLVQIGGLLRVVADDAEDDKFIETAQVAGAEYLVSGDHHTPQAWHTWKSQGPDRPCLP
ncbi:MAG: putative toxin-antitoxin system toxin component, PIN family [Nitrospirae bacterium]|nr:putative toxin-antitoxin system toxin component, PIN family [Nitrospirota bacterium]